MSVSLVLGALLILLFILLVVNNKCLRKKIRYWNLLAELPTIPGKRLLLGHSLILLGISREAEWVMSRNILKSCPPIFTLYLPMLTLVAIQGPDEYEKLTSSTKHLGKTKSYEFLHTWLGKGLLTSEGLQWQQRRKILTPAFHFSILRDFLEIFNRETKYFIQNIEQNFVDKPVDVVPLISDFTLSTISETSMGTKLDIANEEGLSYKKAITQIADLNFKRLTTFWLWYQRIYDWTPFRKIEQEALRILHRFTEKIIAKRCENFQVFDENFEGSSTKRKYPLLDILLNAKYKYQAIDDISIREEVDTFMFEGHDTTATCLNFTTMLLAVHKQTQNEVYQEIVSIIGKDLSNEPTYSDLQQMQLLERCIKESLRLYPPVPLIGRTTSEDIATEYGTIPKGTSTFTHLYDYHRNPTYWPDPDRFDPSRHLPENCKNRHPFAFIPFSAGPRNCIGQRFAMLEMKAFYCGLLRKFILEPVDTPDTLVLYNHLVIRSLHGVTVKFVNRK